MTGLFLVEGFPLHIANRMSDSNPSRPSWLVRDRCHEWKAEPLERRE